MHWASVIYMDFYINGRFVVFLCQFLLEWNSNNSWKPCLPDRVAQYSFFALILNFFFNALGFCYLHGFLHKWKICCFTMPVLVGVEFILFTHALCINNFFDEIMNTQTIPANLACLIGLLSMHFLH